MSADSIIVSAKVLPRGAVQRPPKVRDRLGLKLGMKLIGATVDDALVMKKARVEGRSIAPLVGFHR